MGVEEIGRLYRHYLYGGLNQNQFEAELRGLRKQLTAEEHRSIDSLLRRPFRRRPDLRL